MQRFSQWISLAAVAALGLFSAFSVEPTCAAPQVTFADLSMNDQFNLFAPITCNSSSDAVAKWLDEVDEIMGRVAMGGVTSLPENAVKAIETIANVVVSTDSLLQDKTVLRKVLAMTPAIWTSGYWYAPIATWKPLFLSVWTKPVAFAKRACDEKKSDHDACDAYDVAVNATSLMIRFTKDNYFLNGEKDTGAFDNALSKGYLTFLPEVVAKLFKTSNFSLSEKQLRAYMNTIPSKRDGMDMSVAFPTFVDTARYKSSDAAALRAFLLKTPSADDNGNAYANVNGTPAQNY